MSFEATLLYGMSYSPQKGQAPHKLDANTIAKAKGEARSWLRSNRIMARAASSAAHPIPTAADVAQNGKSIARVRPE